MTLNSLKAVLKKYSQAIRKKYHEQYNLDNRNILNAFVNEFGLKNFSNLDHHFENNITTSVVLDWENIAQQLVPDNQEFVSELVSFIDNNITLNFTQ